VCGGGIAGEMHQPVHADGRETPDTHVCLLLSVPGDDVTLPKAVTTLRMRSMRLT
jgi:hypothetical protein